MNNVVRLSACLFCAFLAAFPASGIDEERFEQEFKLQVKPWFETSRRTGELRAADGLVLRWYSIESPREKRRSSCCRGGRSLRNPMPRSCTTCATSACPSLSSTTRARDSSGGEVTPRDRWYLRSWQSLLSDLDLFMERVLSAPGPTQRPSFTGTRWAGRSPSHTWAGTPDAAQALVMTVPMFAPRTAPFPLFAVSAAAGLYTLFGQGRAYLPGYGPYARHPLRGQPVVDFQPGTLRIPGPAERIPHGVPAWGATARGGPEPLRLSRAAREATARITRAALLVQAGKDAAVRKEPQDRAQRAMADCRIVRVDEAHHIIMHAEDLGAQQGLTAVRQFLGEQLE
ncbi:MAG: hypothetical protein MZU91_14330 [Desulfosudis oleivorans]|nr:hypothetical protein [Desulfosudis oleivorans]